MRLCAQHPRTPATRQENDECGSVDLAGDARASLPATSDVSLSNAAPAASHLTEMAA
ncbi:hypothetical protein [Streptomyces griseus]|uniref:hypothetical protein n=1 Tax=Streptomyces griseus TaxID=1911 RepID=UPI0037A474DA